MKNEFAETSPEMSRHLKELGFPQPKPAPGQAWYNLLHTPFFLYETMNRKIGARNVYNGILSPFDGVASEGMVYAPTVAEAVKFLNQ
jgi:hypothetical protein